MLTLLDISDCGNVTDGALATIAAGLKHQTPGIGKTERRMVSGGQSVVSRAQMGVPVRKACRGDRSATF